MRLRCLVPRQGCLAWAVGCDGCLLATFESVVSWYYPGITKVVSIKMNPALLLRIDGLTSNRSDLIRAAVEEEVKRAGAKGKSAWDALAKAEGLDITIPKAAGQVKRTDL